MEAETVNGSHELETDSNEKILKPRRPKTTFRGNAKDQKSSVQNGCDGKVSNSDNNGVENGHFADDSDSSKETGNKNITNDNIGDAKESTGRNLRKSVREVTPRPEAIKRESRRRETSPRPRVSTPKKLDRQKDVKSQVEVDKQPVDKNAEKTTSNSQTSKKEELLTESKSSGSTAKTPAKKLCDEIESKEEVISGSAAKTPAKKLYEDIESKDEENQVESDEVNVIDVTEKVYNGNEIITLDESSIMQNDECFIDVEEASESYDVISIDDSMDVKEKTTAERCGFLSLKNNTIEDGKDILEASSTSSMVSCQNEPNVDSSERQVEVKVTKPVNCFSKFPGRTVKIITMDKKGKRKAEDDIFDSTEVKRFAGDTEVETGSEASPGWRFFSSSWSRSHKCSTPFQKKTEGDSMSVNYDENTVMGDPEKSTNEVSYEEAKKWRCNIM